MTQLCMWISSRKIGGSEDTTRGSPAQDPLLSPYSQSILLFNFLGVFLVNVPLPLLVLSDKYM